MAILAACGSSADTETPRRGRWNGNTFTNEFFGLRFNMPNDWVATDEKEVAEMFAGITEHFPPAGAEITPDMYQLAMEIGIFDMMASDGDTDAFADDNVHIVMSMVLMSAEDAHMTAPEWMAHRMEVLGTPHILHDGTVRIGSLDWYYMDFSPGGEVHNRLYFNEEGYFIRQINIVFRADEHLNQALGMFRAY